MSAPAPWTASVLTLFPEMFPGPLGHSLAGRALQEGRWRLEAINLRDFATDRHRTVDDVPFGGGAGMVMRPDVVARAIDAARGSRAGTTGRVPDPARAPADPAAGRGACRGSRCRDLMRPLRGGRPAGRRSARLGGAFSGRHRAGGRRAGGDRPDRCLCPPAPGRDRGAGVAVRGELRARPAGVSRTTPDPRSGRGVPCRRCWSPATMRASAPGAPSRPSGSPDVAAPTCGRAIWKAPRLLTEGLVRGRPDDQ